MSLLGLNEVADIVRKFVGLYLAILLPVVAATTPEDDHADAIRVLGVTNIVVKNPGYFVSPQRSSFGKHMFVRHDAKVFDACCGPQLGVLDESGYVSATIDGSTPNEAWKAGNASDIVSVSISSIQ